MKRKFHSTKTKRWAGRQARVTRKLGRSDRPRLTVFRTAKHIYAQIDDTSTGRTLVTVSSRSSKITTVPGGGIDVAKAVGKAIAEVAREKQIDRVVFNRNGFLYHGRVKALAEAAREAGLQF